MYNVLLVDDEPDILDLLEPSFWDEGFKVYRAECNKEAIQISSKIPIDVLVCDMVIPHEQGNHILGEIKKLSHRSVAIAITGYENIFANEAFDKDVHCFLRKPITPEEILSAVKRYIKLVFPENRLKESLSKREFEIAKHITSGLTSREIAELCKISIRTVEKHRENILRRLNLKNTIELVSSFK